MRLVLDNGIVSMDAGWAFLKSMGCTQPRDPPRLSLKVWGRSPARQRWVPSWWLWLRGPHTRTASVLRLSCRCSGSADRCYSHLNQDNCARSRYSASFRIRQCVVCWWHESLILYCGSKVLYIPRRLAASPSIVSMILSLIQTVIMLFFCAIWWALTALPSFVHSSSANTHIQPRCKSASRKTKQLRLSLGLSANLLEAIDQGLLQTFNLYEQYAASAYCATNNDEAAGADILCSSGNCPLVQAAKAIAVFEFAE